MPTWKDDAITVHVLDGDSYAQREMSACLPDFNFALALDVMKLEALSDVKRALREHYAV